MFPEKAPFDFILRVFEVMNGAHWHTFQVLTKRSERLAKLSPRLPWPRNLWMGVSIESADYLFRLDHLRNTRAKVKFLSLEPLLGPLPGLDLTGIDWVIVGGESGPGARRMDPTWVTDIRDQCQGARVPFFFKQWGTTNKKRAGRLLESNSMSDPMLHQTVLPDGSGGFLPCPELLTEEEAIRYLRLDIDGPANPSLTLRYYREKGLLRATRVGRRLRYRRVELERLLEQLTPVEERIARFG